MRFSREDYERMSDEELCELMKLTNPVTGLMSPRARWAQKILHERHSFSVSDSDRMSNWDDCFWD